MADEVRSGLETSGHNWPHDWLAGYDAGTYCVYAEQDEYGDLFFATRDAEDADHLASILRNHEDVIVRLQSDLEQANREKEELRAALESCRGQNNPDGHLRFVVEVRGLGAMANAPRAISQRFCEVLDEAARPHFPFWDVSVHLCEAPFAALTSPIPQAQREEG